MKEKLIILSAPSGCGKGTIIGRLTDEHPELRLGVSVSATSRPPRDNEQDGKHYYFLSPDEFRRRIEAGDFIEYEEVYGHQHYGTLHSEVEGRWEKGQNVVMDIDVNGALRMKQIYGDKALTLFILPPSIEALRQRLIARGTETLEKIEKRMERAEYEISRAPEFEAQVLNDDLDIAVNDVLKVITDFINK